MSFVDGPTGQQTNGIKEWMLVNKENLNTKKWTSLNCKQKIQVSSISFLTNG